MTNFATFQIFNMNENSALKSEIKQLIVETLGLKDTDPATILDDKPLCTGENVITLDSIDGIELIMAIQRNYGARLDVENLARTILNTVDSMAEFITSANDAR